jgi:hypothetical protein
MAVSHEERGFYQLPPLHGKARDKRKQVHRNEHGFEQQYQLQGVEQGSEGWVHVVDGVALRLFAINNLRPVGVFCEIAREKYVHVPQQHGGERQNNDEQRRRAQELAAETRPKVRKEITVALGYAPRGHIVNRGGSRARRNDGYRKDYPQEAQQHNVRKHIPVLEYRPVEVKEIIHMNIIHHIP